jgi:threonine dehydrogenase-like Zn-dependent dehydrogenase
MRWPGDGRTEIVEMLTPAPGPGGDPSARRGLRALRQRPPRVPGREFCGVPGHAAVVEALGSGLTEPSPGTRGVVFMVRSCGQCRSCQADSPNRCLDRLASTASLAAVAVTF